MPYRASHILSLFFGIQLFILFVASTLYAYERECGTVKIIENLIQHQEQPYYASTLYREDKCSPEKYYDSVYTIKTQHFQVIYVLNGPHATTKAFADSVASSMEAAWDFYIRKQQMRTPKGPSMSYHYQQKITEDLYPVEIIDIDQIRNGYTFFKNSNECGSCFAFTVPLENHTTSQIFMDNDFYHGSFQNKNKDTIFVDGDTCIYSKANIPLHNSAHNFDYTNEWAKGIRLTTFHELYHAVQLRYLNILTNNTFWFEASATGFEEITNPEIDDYFSYLPKFFNNMGQPLSANFKNYGAATLFLYLYQKVSTDLDKSIWENFSKNPDNTFESQLESSLKSLKLDADSVFHDFSVRLSFSGAHSKSLSKKDWISEDQSNWPSAVFFTNESINPNLESLAFEFYRTPYAYISPDLTNFIGKASIIIYNKDSASIHNIKNNKSLDSLISILSTCDSSIWIFSRLGVSESIPLKNNSAPPHAFPVPWKQGSLCFAPLPLHKNFIEIRNRRGDLISQEKYEGTSYCLSEENVKSMMAPGIYRFRVGNKGKTTSFLIVY